MKVAWDSVFGDIQNWMEANNVMLQRHSFDSDEYWDWVIKTLSIIQQRYNHPLVTKFVNSILDYQEETWKELHKEDLS